VAKFCISSRKKFELMLALTVYDKMIGRLNNGHIAYDDLEIADGECLRSF